MTADLEPIIEVPAPSRASRRELHAARLLCILIAALLPIALVSFAKPAVAATIATLARSSKAFQRRNAAPTPRIRMPMKTSRSLPSR